MSRAPTSAAIAGSARKTPCWTARPAPMKTGAAAAVSVRGRAASIQICARDMGGAPTDSEWASVIQPGWRRPERSLALEPPVVKARELPDVDQVVREPGREQVARAHRAQRGM